MPASDGVTAGSIGTGLGSLGYRLAVTARRARAGFEQHLADAGASFAAWTVLETLSVYGPMIQRDLAESLGVSGQTLARQVDRMVGAGWLERLEVEGDRRAVRLRLTTEGGAAHQRLARVAREANEQLVQGLSREEVAVFSGLLNRLASNVG